MDSIISEALFILNSVTLWFCSLWNLKTYCSISAHFIIFQHGYNFIGKVQNEAINVKSSRLKMALGKYNLSSFLFLPHLYSPLSLPSVLHFTDPHKIALPFSKSFSKPRTLELSHSVLWFPAFKICFSGLFIYYFHFTEMLVTKILLSLFFMRNLRIVEMIRKLLKATQLRHRTLIKLNLVFKPYLFANHVSSQISLFKYCICYN